jgi:hypothetical protein
LFQDDLSILTLLSGAWPGGASGLSRDLGLELHTQGAMLVLIDLNEERGKETSDYLDSLNSKCAGWANLNPSHHILTLS